LTRAVRSLGIACGLLALCSAPGPLAAQDGDEGVRQVAEEMGLVERPALGSIPRNRSSP
jgi:hypothetical protein